MIRFLATMSNLEVFFHHYLSCKHPQTILAKRSGKYWKFFEGKEFLAGLPSSLSREGAGSFFVLKPQEAFPLKIKVLCT